MFYINGENVIKNELFYHNQLTNLNISTNINIDTHTPLFYGIYVTCYIISLNYYIGLQL